MGDSETTYADKDLAIINTDIKYKLGTATSFLAGYKFSSFRAELESFSHSNDFNDVYAFKVRKIPGVTGKATASTVLINGYYDFKVDNPKLTPYVGIGFGSTTFKFNYKNDGDTLIDDDDNVVSVAITGGVDFAIGDKFSVGVGGRHIEYGDAKLKDPGDNMVTISTGLSSAFLITAKYKF